MNYTDIDFAFFLPVVFCVYWLLPRERRWQNGYLLLASYVFYASWSPRLLPVLLLSTAVDFAVGRYLAAHPDEPGKRRGALLVSLLYNVAQLCFFKYVGFFAESLNDLLEVLNIHGSLPVLRIVLPIGISFYTFQKISYVLDVYDGRIPAARSALDFALFCAFFPQIVAGPIVRGGDLLPQLAAPRRLDLDQLRAGCGLFLLGFFKKAYLAEYLGQYLVQPVFAAPASYSAAGHWIALLGYGAQVFCDFSGYSEMAIGCARLLGLELPVNFNYPYLSKNLIEFWRRWHITLNTFLFDYIYGPLTAGQGAMRGRFDAGFLLVFLLSGLWHGARWTFIVWGLLHAVALIATRRYDEFYRGLCRRDRKDRVWVRRRKGTGYAAAAWAGTQLFFLLTLIPFRAPSLGDAVAYARGLLSSSGTVLVPDKAPYLRNPSFALCALLIIGYHLLEATAPGRALRARFFALPPLLRGAAYGLTVAFLFVFMPLSSGTFIYALF